TRARAEIDSAGSLTASASGAMCSSPAPTLCYQDTAVGIMEPGDPGPTAGADWIWFVREADSIAIVGPTDSYMTTNLGDDHDSAHNNTSTFHGVADRDGILAVRLDILDVAIGSSVPYVLRFTQRETSARERLVTTGERAQLTIASSNVRDSFSVVPL